MVIIMPFGESGLSLYLPIFPAENAYAKEWNRWTDYMPWII